MKYPRLAFLTILALPILVIAALVTVHCNSVARTSEYAFEEATGSTELENFKAYAATTEGQTIASFIISPATLLGGQQSTGTIRLRYPAAAGGVSVSLSTDNASVANIPRHVIIPEGQTSVQFPITIKPVNGLTSFNVSAASKTASEAGSIPVLPRAQRSWFVSADADARGDGSKRHPWTLDAALSGGPGGNEVNPGDVIWLSEGRYRGTFTSILKGSSSAPVVVRARPGARVIIDKALVDDEKRPALRVKGSWVWFWGIEIMNSNADRRRISPYNGSDRPWRGAGADVYASNVKFINMIFHDNGQGIWDKQDMTEVHGCLFFYNGNNKREHALYIGNASGTKYITDNIVFDQGGYGILAHSDSTSSSQKGLHIEGNIVFDNGMLTGDDQKTGNLQVGGVSGVSAERITIKNNYIYNSASNANSKNSGIRLGYEDRANKDVRLLDNFIVSSNPLAISYWQSVDFTGNTIYSTEDGIEIAKPDVDFSRYHWDFNIYFPGKRSGSLFTVGAREFNLGNWQKQTGLDAHSKVIVSERPAEVEVFVRPNRFEAGRANIVIYNWELKDRVPVDLSSILKVGIDFELRDAQNYFGAPVVSGTYKGGLIQLPMTLTAVTQPVGNVERVPRHTSPEFAVFVLITKAGKTAI